MHIISEKRMYFSQWAKSYFSWSMIKFQVIYGKQIIHKTVCFFASNNCQFSIFTCINYMYILARYVYILESTIVSQTAQDTYYDTKYILWIWQARDLWCTSSVQMNDSTFQINSSFFRIIHLPPDPVAIPSAANPLKWQLLNEHFGLEIPRAPSLACTFNRFERISPLGTIIS